jgi:transposase
MNAYSKDLRARVLDAVDRGLPRREISNLFGVSLSTIKRWAKRRREGKDLEPKPSTARKRRILASAEEKRALWEQLEENDEATLERHCEPWEKERGVRVSIATMSRARSATSSSAGPTKKDAGCLRARRTGTKYLARASERSRSSPFRFRRRMLNQRAHGAPQSEGTQG